MSLTLGLLGGMGPAASVVFLERLQALTPARTERDHIRVIADINPGVPDLTVPGSGAGPVLAEMAGALRGAGADVLAIACNAAHAHADLIQRASGLPLIDMIETASAAAAASGVRRVGVLGVSRALKLYREYLAAGAMGMITLPPERQVEFTALLDRVRAGDLSAEAQAQMAAAAAELVAEGAEAIIAGCTEITLVLGPEHVRVELIDPAEHLARRCVDVCLGLEAVPQLLGS